MGTALEDGGRGEGVALREGRGSRRGGGLVVNWRGGDVALKRNSLRSCYLKSPLPGPPLEGRGCGENLRAL